MTPFRLVLPAVGRNAVVEVDGTRVADVASVAVKTSTDEPTRLYLELTGAGTIEGDGIVHVVKPAIRAAVADWLAAIDPEELEKAALDRMSGFGGGSTGASMLEVLRGWAGGDA